MFSKIMVPIDLEHADRSAKAREVAADLARRHGAALCFVAVGPPAPGPLGRTPEEFARHLSEFAQREAAAHGVEAEGRAFIAHDPAAELDKTLERAVRETEADLVVVGSHHPTLMDRVWSSHGGGLAAHADVSVFVVR